MKICFIYRECGEHCKCAEIDGNSITPNDIDIILDSSINLNHRLKVWRASKEVGKELKPGLISLQELRNKSVQPLGYNDFFSYQVSEYGMSTDEMMKLTRKLFSEVWPPQITGAARKQVNS